MQIISYPTEQLVQKFREFWLELAQQFIAQKGTFCVALSGGRSPRIFLKALRSISADIWAKTSAYQVDERYVDHDHVDSNWKMLNEELFDHVSCDQLFPMVTGAGSIEKEVSFYRDKIKEVQFDLILLGIGDDGHTASLFPENNFLQMNDLVVATQCSYLSHVRISMTLDVINQADNVFFLSLGESKRDVVKKVLGKEQKYPASYVSPSSKKLFLYVNYPI